MSPINMRRVSFLLLLFALPPWSLADESEPRKIPYREELEVVSKIDQQEYPSVAVLTSEDLERLEARRMSEALALIPGITPSRVGSRNEGSFFLRGYNMRQVPIYVDGIPVYVPYDGLVDLDRMLTTDLGGVLVNRGFSSLLYGPNALGGTINLLLHRPTRGLEFSGALAFATGGESSGDVKYGTRQGRWFLAASASYLDRDEYLLSGAFDETATEDGDERANSYATDHKASFTVGFVPDSENEYALTYINQQGEKGTPPYAGRDESVRIRYWQWPEWDKESLYYRSHTAIGDGSYLKTRAYYDTFSNTLRSFDDGSYSTQERRSSFTSYFDDDTLGASLEIGKSFGGEHWIMASAHYKRDTHRQRNAGDPWLRFSDELLSLAVESNFVLGQRDRLIVGVSFDDESTRETAGEEPASAGAVNAQVAWFRELDPQTTIHASLSRRSRIPTIRDRYSYRLGRSLPNPELDVERSLNLETGFRRALGARVELSIVAFYNRLDDAFEIVFVEDNVTQLQNVAEVNSGGFEFEAKGRISSSVTCMAGYTYINRSNESPGELGNIELTDIPDHRVYGYLVAELTPKLTLIGGVEFESARTSLNDAGNLVDLGGFSVFNLKARYRLREAWSLEAGAMNVFDENYQRVDGYPEEGRRLFMRLRYDL